MSETRDTFTGGLHKQERKTIWEMDWRLCCPVIGTCLSLSDQKKILKKTRVSLDGMSDFDVHALLAQATNEIFADMHMLMHCQGCLVRQELQQVKRLRAENQKLTGKLREARKRARESTQVLSVSEKAQAELERTARAVEAENETLKRDGQSQRLWKENEALRTQLEKMEYRLQTRVAAVERVKAENEQLTAEMASQVEINQLMRAEVERMLKEMLRDEERCEICPNRDLCARRVMLVDGITKLRTFYRDLVEEMGGEFKYHDGYVSSGEQALENLVGWANVVLCPVDVNSHRACLCVKETCKQSKKPYYMLPSSSVSSISRALADVAMDSEQ